MRSAVPPEPTRDGYVAHPSWGLVQVARVSSSRQRLFQSDVAHSTYVVLSVKRAERKRELNRDWLYPGKEIVEIGLSHAQWGELLSSFNSGEGVPCTIMAVQQETMPSCAEEGRFEVARQEVVGTFKEALASVRDAHANLDAAIATGKIGAIKKASEALRVAVGNAPSNASFAADQFSRHAEDVVQKAKSEIEAYIGSRAGVNGRGRGGGRS